MVKPENPSWLKQKQEPQKLTNKNKNKIKTHCTPFFKLPFLVFHRTDTRWCDERLKPGSLQYRDNDHFLNESRRDTVPWQCPLPHHSVFITTWVNGQWQPDEEFGFECRFGCRWGDRRLWIACSLVFVWWVGVWFFRVFQCCVSDFCF